MSATAPETTSDVEPRSGGRPTFVSIQVLRGLAAVLIVLNHSVSALPNVPALQEGFFRATVPFECGVDIFFIVSGFVMAAVTDGRRRPSPRTLLARRAVRIFPLYWLVCLIYLPSALLVQGLGSQAMDAISLLRSFLLLPQDQRLIAQSWTLTHEWEFYGVVALTLALGLRRRLATVLLLLTLLGLAQEATGTRLASDTVVSGFMAEFLAGLLLYQARDRLPSHLPPGRAATSLIAAAGILLVEAVTQWTSHGVVPRLLMSGVPALLVVAGTIAFEAPLRQGQTTGLGRLGRLLGDTSYSIYLCHLGVLAGIGAALTVWGLENPTSLLATTAIAVVLATGFGVAVGVWIELPLLARGKTWLADRSRRPSGGTARRLRGTRQGGGEQDATRERTRA